MRIGMCIASLLGVFMSCIVSLADVMARCDASLHDARIELESIQAFFNDAMRRDTTHYIYCEPAFSLNWRSRRRRKKEQFFDFFQHRFLGFYKAELKSEDRFVLRKVKAFCRYLFC